MSLIERVEQTIADHELLAPGQKVLVAVSGGPDSTSLLHALRGLGYQVHAAHLRHGIRGQEADEDAHFVQELCKKLAIPCHVGQREVPKLARERHLGIQEAARAARYEFLSETASQIGTGAVATGHTADDHVETVLLNILRGTGVDGLRGIPYRRGIFVRPLLDTWRADVEAYCEEQGLNPRRDSSNQANTYARNNIRSELIPYLARRYNPAVKDAVLRLSEIASVESDYLAGIAQEWLAGRAAIPVTEFTLLPLALQRRVLREWIRNQRRDELANIGHETIEALRAAAGAPFAITLPGGEWLARGDVSLLTLVRLERPEAVPPVEIPIEELPATIRFFDWEVTIWGDAGPEGYSLCLRSWRDGDRIRLAGGTRKLQDIFTDAKVPRLDRHTWPILADDDGPLVVANLAVSVRAGGLQVQATKSG